MNPKLRRCCRYRHPRRRHQVEQLGPLVSRVLPPHRPTVARERLGALCGGDTADTVDRLAKVDVLVIDEMGYLNLRPEQTNIFFKLMEERYRHRSTIITTNLAYDEWANFLGNKALVAALLSRLREKCHTVKIDGPSLRDPTG